MEIRLVVEKRHVVVLTCVILVCTGLLFAVANNGNGNDPSYFGHGVDEIDWSQPIPSNWIDAGLPSSSNNIVVRNYDANSALHLRADTQGKAFVSNMNNFVNNGAQENDYLTLIGQQGIRLNYGSEGTSGTEAMRISNTGNVLVFTEPTANNHVATKGYVDSNSGFIVDRPRTIPESNLISNNGWTNSHGVPLYAQISVYTWNDGAAMFRLEYSEADSSTWHVAAVMKIDAIHGRGTMSAMMAPGAQIRVTSNSQPMTTDDIARATYQRLQ